MAAAARNTKKAPANVPVTGLGETIEDITKLCNDLKATLAKTFKVKSLTDEQIEAAYRFGVAERRHRKLARKIGKSNGAADEE